MNLIFNLVKFGLAIAMTYNIIKGNIQMATFIGVCMILIKDNKN